MGTWNTKINGSDAFLDIYEAFFNLYNQGKDPVDISKTIKAQFAEELADYDEKNHSLFGLALAQWEVNSLDPKIFQRVKETIDTGNDLEIWRQLGADEKTIQQRKCRRSLPKCWGQPPLSRQTLNYNTIQIVFEIGQWPAAPELQLID